MNQVDFSLPNGFPLEADATLGFMQTDYQSAIRGIGRYFGEAVIISGMVESGGAVSDGWIMIGGELVFFQGGTISANFVITETWVQKANQDGTLVNRYLTKKAQFGSGSVTYTYASLQRIETIQALQNRILDAIVFEPEVVLSGLVVSSVNTGLSTLAISAGVAVINRKFVTAPAYAGGYPVYLKEDGTWTNTAPASNFIALNPYTSQRFADVIGRASAPLGDVRMRVTLSSSFDNTGLGKWDLQGWAVCNGANGTVDLRSRFSVAYDNRNTDPGGNLWDSVYMTPGQTGGEKNHILTVGEMPSHRHGPATPAEGEFGLARRTVTGENKTSAGTDTLNSGQEIDITPSGQPAGIALAGGGGGHENRPPFMVLVYIQRI